LDLNTFQIIWLEGYLTAANGDQLFMKMVGNSINIIGGTGRFEGATGTGTAVSSDMEVTVDRVAGTMTITSKSTIEGSITY
jgi:hypothetical protein